MRTAIALIMIAVVALVALGLGCTHDRTFDYLGTWEAHRQLKPQPGTDSEVVYQASRVILTLNKDGTFDLTDAGFSHGGTFEVEGDYAVLTITSVLGQPMSRQDPEVRARNKPIRITPQPDGTLRYYDPGGFDQTGLIMTRQSATKK